MTDTALLSDDLYAQIRGFVRRRLTEGADIDDVVQQIALKALEAAPRDGQRLAPWVFRTARNAVVDAQRAVVRSQARGSSLFPDDLTPNGWTEEMETHAEARAVARYVRELLERLPPDDRDALLRVDAGGLDQHTFAKELGLPYPTAKSRIQRARKRLRQALEADCHLELDGCGKPIHCRPRTARCCESDRIR